MKKTHPGINIQHPISQLILSGEKTVETRTYPLPEKYVGKTLLLVETPGRTRGFKARVIARIQFGKSFPYKSKQEFYLDLRRHRVQKSSPWAWKEKTKWGWPITLIEPFETPFQVEQRIGIVFTRALNLECNGSIA